MKTVTAEGLKMEIGGNSITIVDIPMLERPFLIRKEQRQAKRYAAQILESEKEELEKEDFDVNDFCRAWWHNECATLQTQIDLGVDSLSPAQLKQFENRLQANLSLFDNESTKWATLYAQRNGGQKPPQTAWEKEVNAIAETYSLLGMYANFVRDENGKYLFSHSAEVYTDEKVFVINLIQTNSELFDTIQSVVKNGLGFTMKQRENKESAITETSLQLQNTADTE